jgi:hypothetical protein
MSGLGIARAAGAAGGAIPAVPGSTDRIPVATGSRIPC